MKHFSQAYAQAHTEREVYDTRRMTYKSVSAVEFSDKRGEGKAMVLRLQSPEKSADMNIRIGMTKEMPGFTCVVQLKNRFEETRVESIETLVLDVDNASRVATGWNGRELRFFNNGFHSWSLSRALPVGVGENTSHCFSVLNNFVTKKAVIIGFVTMADQLTTISALGRESEESRLAQIRASSSTDRVVVPRNQTVVSEEMLLLVIEDALRGLETYAEITAARMNALSWHNVPVGWCSWYYYFTLIDEREVLLNAEHLKERFGQDIEWVQLDDGFQKTVGDWNVNDKFESGLKSLVKEIGDSGFKPGVWIAPFIATEHSIIFKERPEWFVHDAQNRPIVVRENPLWLGNIYALDLTNPEVISHIGSLFKDLVEDGFQYFKIDFIHDAAVEGQRHDTSITRGQAIRKGLETIRSSVGDSFILGCGAPLGLSIGIVNGMRIGDDVAPVWQYDQGIGIYPAAINTLTRAFMNKRWWINDPDCVLIRQDDTSITEDELRLWLTIVALSGGMLLLSDKMDEVSEERLTMFNKLLPPFGPGATAIDALVEALPRFFTLSIETPLGRWALVATINLGEMPLDVSFTLKQAGLTEDKPHHVFDFWEEEYQGLVEDQVEVNLLKPHSCKLLLVRPESETPCVLSTSMHFTQGAVELKDQRWNGEDLCLEVMVDRSTKSEESVFFVFGSDWKPESALIDDENVKLQRVAPEVIAVKAQFENGQTIRVDFSQRL
ncbi:MAG: alpha-galactosidase [Candidatus Thorarchaeota archaeon]|jgi:alpha-galactosidase